MVRWLVLLAELSRLKSRFDRNEYGVVYADSSRFSMLSLNKHKKSDIFAWINSLLGALN